MTGRQLAAPNMVQQHIRLACGTHHCSCPGLAKPCICLTHFHISVWHEPLPPCKHKWCGLRYHLSCRWNSVKSFQKYLLSLLQLRPSRSEGRNVFLSSSKLFKSGPHLGTCLNKWNLALVVHYREILREVKTPWKKIEGRAEYSMFLYAL